MSTYLIAVQLPFAAAVICSLPTYVIKYIIDKTRLSLKTGKTLNFRQMEKTFEWQPETDNGSRRKYTISVCMDRRFDNDRSLLLLL
jgi:hypothetical protein